MQVLPSPSWPVLVAAGLAFIVLILSLVAVRRALTDRPPDAPPANSPGGQVGLGIDFSGSIPTADVSPAPDGQAIVEQMDAIDRFTRRRLNELLSSMVEAGGWQALVRQIDRLYGERTDQLRALADQVSGLPANAALRHTLEAYCLSRLMLALHDQLAGQSAIVTQVLDDWFQAHREISIAQFEAQLHLDCARILLLDLDYASPPPEVALEQLSLAGEHCSRAAAETCRAPRQGVASEIELRRRRIDAVHAPVM